MKLTKQKLKQIIKEELEAVRHPPLYAAWVDALDTKKQDYHRRLYAHVKQRWLQETTSHGTRDKEAYGREAAARGVSGAPPAPGWKEWKDLDKGARYRLLYPIMDYFVDDLGDFLDGDAFIKAAKDMEEFIMNAAAPIYDKIERTELSYPWADNPVTHEEVVDAGLKQLFSSIIEKADEIENLNEPAT